MFFVIIVGVAGFLGSIIACFVAFKLAGSRGTSLGGPRDIRANKPMLERLVETGVDWFSPVGNPQSSIQTIYSAGRNAPHFSGQTTVFKTKLGWRIGVFPMATLLMWVTFTVVFDDAYFAPIDWFVVLASAALCIWLVFYVFAFRVEVLGSDLRSMGPFFDFKTHDLARLTKAEDFGDSYALHFDCGGRVSIPHYVEGHSVLKDLVIHALETNGR